MRLTTRHQILIAILILLTGGTIIFGFVVIPSLRSILNISAQIAREQARVEETLARALRVRATSEDLTVIRKQLPALESMIIEQGREIDFFAALEQKNRAHNLDQLVRLGVARQIVPGVDELPLTFEIRGKFPDFLAYLNDLEHSSELIGISRLSVRATPADKTSAPLNITLDGTIYVSAH